MSQCLPYYLLHVAPVNDVKVIEELFDIIFKCALGPRQTKKFIMWQKNMIFKKNF